MNTHCLFNNFHHVGNYIRPPSHANSILLQATLGYSHSKCTFYEDTNKKFALKDKRHNALADNINLKPEWMRGL